MKKLGFLMLSVLLAFACSKSSDVQPSGGGGGGGGNGNGNGDPSGGTPAVETLSVDRQLDGSVVCKGRIVSGASSLTNDNVGFCADHSPGALYWDEEMRTDIAPDYTFTVTYPAKPGASSKYYRAFGLYAGTYGGTSDVYGADMQPTVPDLGELPCAPQTNSFTLQGFTPGQGTFYLVDGPSPSTTYEVIARLYSSTLQFKVNFGGYPETGVYTTRQAMPTFPGHHDIVVSFSMGPGTTSHTINANQTVYVERISDTVIEITLCDATWGDGVLKKLTTNIRTGN